jgi:hypothetical protein
MLADLAAAAINAACTAQTCNKHHAKFVIIVSTLVYFKALSSCCFIRDHTTFKDHFNTTRTDPCIEIAHPPMSWREDDAPLPTISNDRLGSHDVDR